MLPDEIEVTDYHLAALMQYEGALCISCRTGGSDTTWVFRVPQLDAEYIQQDFANDETTVFLKSFLKSLNEVASFRNFARRSLSGEWRSERYSEPRVRRTA